MDYETINGPKYYFDFENLRQGIEQDIEGDEWFGEKFRSNYGQTNTILFALNL